MTNYDRITTMPPDELAGFLESAGNNLPWASAFARAKCDNCPSDTVTLEGYQLPIEIYPCDCDDHECPHGSAIAWWLEQEATDDG